MYFILFLGNILTVSRAILVEKLQVPLIYVRTTFRDTKRL